jgi:hypothetical protein
VGTEMTTETLRLGPGASAAPGPLRMTVQPQTPRVRRPGGPAMPVAPGGVPRTRTERAGQASVDRRRRRTIPRRRRGRDIRAVVASILAVLAIVGAVTAILTLTAQSTTATLEGEIGALNGRLGRGAPRGGGAAGRGRSSHVAEPERAD